MVKFQYLRVDLVYIVRVAVGVAALMLVAPAWSLGVAAQGFTVLPGEIKNVGQTLHSSGAIGVVEAGGVVSTTADDSDAIFTAGEGVIVDVRGTLSTLGYRAFGVISNGNWFRITQSGTVTVSGNDALGIGSTGDNAVIVQDGVITTSGQTGHGIGSVGEAVRIVQTGRINTSGTGSIGIVSSGINADIMHSGTIATTGINAFGIASSGRDVVVSQSGLISTTGERAHGLLFEGANAEITNSGLIRSTGSGAYAIFFDATALANNLTLAVGTQLEGMIHVDSAAAASLTVNVQNLRSSVIQFHNAMPGTINVTPGLVHAIDPNNLQLLTADVTLQQTVGARFGALVSGAVSALDARHAAGSSARTSSGFAPLGYAQTQDRTSAIFAGFDANRSAPTVNSWAQGFGSTGVQESAGSGRDQRFGVGGFATGADTELVPGWTVGLFAGAGWGEARVSHDRLSDSSLFGGAYGEGVFGDTTVDLAVLLGSSYYDSSRAVSTVGGLQTATAGYSAMFVSPELGLTHRLDTAGQAVEVGGSVRYAGLFIDGYTETGSLGNLSVDGRAVHQVIGRVQVAVPYEILHVDGSSTRVTPRLGAEATSQFGANTASGAIGGNATSFSVNNGESYLGFAGLRFEHATSGTLSLYGDVAGMFSPDSFTRLQASAGLKASF